MKNEKIAKSTRRTALLSLIVAFALILSYIESLIPPIVPIPGVKLGLANIAIVFVMFTLGAKEAIMVSIVRVALISLLFGTPVSAFYSLFGAILSLLSMVILSKLPAFSLIGISVGGGVFHNVGQIFAAAIVLGGGEVFAYLPLLVISGTVAGVAIGVISALTISKFYKHMRVLV